MSQGGGGLLLVYTHVSTCESINITVNTLLQLQALKCDSRYLFEVCNVRECLTQCTQHRHIIMSQVMDLNGQPIPLSKYDRPIHTS